MSDNPILEALRNRRSIRRFKSEQIKDEELQAVLEAGTWAPTAKGMQDPWIVAVQDPALLERISALNARIWGRDTDPFYGAPTYVLVFGSRPDLWQNTLQDGSLVLGNMMLAAHAIGLGSCWINRELEMFATPEGKELMRDLGFEDELAGRLVGIGALALGYPASFPPSVKPRKEGYYRIVR